MNMTYILQSYFLLLIVLFFVADAHAQTSEEIDRYEFVTPQIHGFGAAVKPHDTAEMPQAKSKLVFDITSGKQKDNDEKQPLAALDKVARLINLYAAAGIKPEQIQIAAVFHGDAIKAVLNDQTYSKKHPHSNNPNLDIIRSLNACLQTLAHDDYQREAVSSFVQIAAATMTVLINKQIKGYAYLPLHN